MRNGINPWLSMWGHPRNTIRAIVSSNPKYGVIYLVTIYALQNFFYFSNYWSLGLSYPFYVILIAALLLSPLSGWIWVYVVGWILCFTGGWLGGKAPMSHLRTVAAWSKIPTSISLIMWFILLLAYPEYVFIQDAGGPTLLFVNFITFVLFLWSLVLLIQSVREVQSFSVGRAFLNIFLAWIFSMLFSFIFFAILRFIYIRTIL